MWFRRRHALRYFPEGCVAYPCPHCGEFTLADCEREVDADVCMDDEPPPPEFTIARLGRCRQCANECGYLDPELTYPKPLPDEPARPTPEFIEQSNPGALKKPAAPLPQGLELPAGVTRRQWALLSGIVAEIAWQVRHGDWHKRRRQIQKVNLVNAFAGYGLIAILMRGWPSAQATAIWLGLCLLVHLAAWAWCRYYEFVPVHDTLTLALWRYRRAGDRELRELRAAAQALGPRFRPASRYLTWYKLDT